MVRPPPLAAKAEACRAPSRRPARPAAAGKWAAYFTWSVSVIASDAMATTIALCTSLGAVPPPPPLPRDIAPSLSAARYAFAFCPDASRTTDTRITTVRSCASCRAATARAAFVCAASSAATLFAATCLAAMLAALLPSAKNGEGEWTVQPPYVTLGDVDPPPTPPIIACSRRRVSRRAAMQLTARMVERCCVRGRKAGDSRTVPFVGGRGG